MSDEKTNTLNLTAGAILILNEVIPTPNWYKDDPKAGVLIVRAASFHEGLPDLGRRPVPPQKTATDTNETLTDKILASETEAKAWSERQYSLPITEKQKDAVKVCLKHYLKQGSFSVTKHTVNVLSEFGLDE